MKISTVIYTLLSIAVSACTIPKEARIMKRTTKEWRKSQIILHAWADTPFYGVFLNLRSNGKFEYFTSGLLQSFEAGKWTKVEDTIRLEYLDSKQNIVRTQMLMVDRQNSTLKFDKDSTPVQIRLKVMTNEFK